jgi:NADH:ubiquinone oxidoreductase subunit F (NADH-binding)
MNAPRSMLVADRAIGAGPESMAEHRARFGDLPRGGPHVIDALDAAQLRGRGGAGFPVGAKWRTVAGQRGPAVVLVNGAEGEPLSRKDHALMVTRPHLVIDGAEVAAQSVGADHIVFYVGARLRDARSALQSALSERGVSSTVRFVEAPQRYVAGEESAAVHAVNQGLALPTSKPPRPFLRGVAGRPTLVQNVESLAHAALVSRGRNSDTVLVTLSGHGGPATVVEAPCGSSLESVVHAAGSALDGTEAVLLGGFFGTWLPVDEARRLVLDVATLQHRSLGAGVLALLPAQQCGLVVTAQLAAYLAGESARQCGPCVFGLAAIAAALQRIAACHPEPHDLTRVRSWAAEVRGRGACRHPDGFAALVLSALRVFEHEVERHMGARRCTRGGAPHGDSLWTRSAA